MSVVLTKYPVTTEGGKILNVFAGFNDVIAEFKREDSQILGVGSGVDNNISISISGDLSNELNIGEWIYLYSEASTLTYDKSYKIISVNYSAPNTTITVAGDFIEISSSGYINYRQNYYLESKLVLPSNNAVKVYDALLQNDGSPSGVIKVNSSDLVDALSSSFETTSQQLINSRQECKIMIREVWRENQTEIFSLVSGESIVIIYSSEQQETELFVSDFEEPKMWAGYPTFVNALHSKENNTGFVLSVDFDELDINKSNLTTANALVTFKSGDFGILQSNFNDNLVILNENTQFIKYNLGTSTAGDYASNDYNSSDYKTTA